MERAVLIPALLTYLSCHPYSLDCAGPGSVFEIQGMCAWSYDLLLPRFIDDGFFLGKKKKDGNAFAP